MRKDATAFSNDAEHRAARWLKAWDGQGTHRTATPGDDAGAEWLAAEARALGADVAIEEFALDRLDLVEARLEIGGERMLAVPAFDAPATDAAGVEARFGPAGSDAEIGVAELSPRAVYSGKYRELRRGGSHRGLVILCAGEEPGLALLNAEEFRTPYGAPTIHVSSTERDCVLTAAAQRAPARLVSASRRTPARGRNVIVTLGAAAAGPPLVVMTPRSSWWQSVAERGGGIVCWLESLRVLIAQPLRRRIVFTANSGHELGHLGLDDFVARRPGWDRPVRDGGATWLHYGANIGAAGGALSLVAPDDALRDLAVRELNAAGRPADTIAPKTLVPSGETRDIHRAGGRYLTLVGTNRWFHLPQDRWPDAVDVAAIARIARASAGITLALSR